EPSSSHQSLVQVEDLLLQHPNKNSPTLSIRIKFQSKSLDDLQIHRQYRRKQSNDNHVSNTT
ncbi:unnamed protein product, partial [Adineta steineri]